MTSIDYTFTIYKDHESGNSFESIINNYVQKRLFFRIMDMFPEFTHIQDTVFIQEELAKELASSENDDGQLKEFIIDFDDRYLLDYDESKYINRQPRISELYEYSKVQWNRVIVAELKYGENYRDLKLLYDIAQELSKNLVTYDYLVDEAYLEALRVKEENRGIKLTNEQSRVLTLVEEQCRWYHIPSDDQEKILQCFPVTPKFREAEITEVIDDIQFENLMCMGTILGHTILFGFHLPYMNYADEADYKSCTDHTARLKEILNRLSKAFGSAEFYEYREEDPDIMRMVLSKKGKFVYASLFAEGEFDQEYGTSKRTISPDAKTYWKTVKKWGMTPADLLTYVMKQKLPVKVFRQEMYWKWASEG